MKQKLSIFICIVGLLYISLAQSEGFVADTLVYTKNGTVPVKCIVIGDNVGMYECKISSGNMVAEIACHSVDHGMIMNL
ncbi:MAG TPA: hypothetical protein VLB80_02925 [Candidatus Babeliales bacterium]|nr:hypothetical protein [Candidatus Babeliales bacterium]